MSAPPVKIPEGYEEVPEGEHSNMALYRCARCGKILIGAHFKTVRMATGRTFEHCGEPAWWLADIRPILKPGFNITSSHPLVGTPTQGPQNTPATEVAPSEPITSESLQYFMDGYLEDLTRWEVEFLSSIQKWLGQGRTLTFRQIEVVKKIIKKYEREPEPPVTQFAIEPGAYKLPDGKIYIVKPNRARTRVYAMRLVESTERVTEQGETVNFDFEYERGAIYHIRPEYLMTLEEGQALMIRYGRCIICGRKLKVKESVERGMGPICRRYFRRPNPDGAVPEFEMRKW